MTQRSILTAFALFIAALPLARGVRFTENTAEIPIGDSATRQVAFYGVMKEWGRPLITALRLKVIDGQITEIEAMGVSLPYGTKSGWE